MIGLVNAIAFVSLGFCVWGLICNERTYRQRNSILRAIRHDDGFWRLIEHYDRVSYNAHHWHLFFLLDPYRLYSDDLRRLVRP